MNILLYWLPNEILRIIFINYLEPNDYYNLIEAFPLYIHKLSRFVKVLYDDNHYFPFHEKFSDLVNTYNENDHGYVNSQTYFDKNSMFWPINNNSFLLNDFSSLMEYLNKFEGVIVFEISESIFKTQKFPSINSADTIPIGIVNFLQYLFDYNTSLNLKISISESQDSYENPIFFQKLFKFTCTKMDEVGLKISYLYIPNLKSLSIEEGLDSLNNFRLISRPIFSSNYPIIESNLPNLEHLMIVNQNGFKEISQLNLPNLKSFQLQLSNGKLERFNNFQAQSLDYFRYDVSNYTFDQDNFNNISMPNLKTYFIGCEALSDVSGDNDMLNDLKTWEFLSNAQFGFIKHMHHILNNDLNSKNLTFLLLDGVPLKKYPELITFPSLRYLTILNNDEPLKVPSIEAPMLEALKILDCRSFRDVGPIAKLYPKLLELVLFKVAEFGHMDSETLILNNLLSLDITITNLNIVTLSNCKFESLLSLAISGDNSDTHNPNLKVELKFHDVQTPLIRTLVFYNVDVLNSISTRRFPLLKELHFYSSSIDGLDIAASPFLLMVIIMRLIRRRGILLGYPVHQIPNFTYGEHPNIKCWMPPSNCERRYTLAEEYTENGRRLTYWEIVIKYHSWY
ncbi:hypothetical protein BN7_5553 [Wickerhamomyces ciferrii]|uniref:Internalin-I n=1 Tax=Wickerhamomyces ciferrii (strain ATCC 14091 / BCRC 22168 / CBS 111 / JCM 3599 / NBRC 0793 / NRRL Y-1031 F-60-10) TaxID=1206466 RepID=K0KS25_WICCF|nr:uncharacterized protein BN7_5553 [Wickerhamomyces ciferrii]CCH45966.1 hypothetical protein BN7_5553 [Wickerhamomyces ciferrii]